MREFKIFLIVAIFAGLVYWGVEPYAHSVMSPAVSPANFNFSAEDTDYAKGVVQAKQTALDEARASGDAKAIAAAEKDLNASQAQLAAVEQLWAAVEKIDLAKGDPAKGKEFFESNCFACHGLAQDGIAANITDSSLGVLPPDLSSAGALFDEKFLAALILHPALALKVDHKFGDAFLMTAYNPEAVGESEEVVNKNIADVIAYLKEVSVKFEAAEDENITQALTAKYAALPDSAEKNATIAREAAFAKDRSTFIEACGRCHDVRYDSFVAGSKQEDLKNYLGSVPPDLSMMIRARGEGYLHNFINNTQKLLPGTAMPRVGLTEAAQARVISYLDKVGDSKKDERQSTGLYIIIFFVLLSILAIGWKRHIWARLH